MRVLFTTQPAVGHLHPLVPVARALTAAGHDVAVCSSATFRPDVERFALRHVTGGLEWLASDRETWGAFPPMPPPGGSEFAAFAVTMFADITTRHMVPDLLAVAEAWRPNLIVRESMEYAGCLVAEALGIPHASVGCNGYSAVDSQDVPHFQGNRRLVASALARHRERLGLAPDPETLMPFRNLHLCFTPPSWDGVDMSRPPHIRFLRHENAALPAALPDWAARRGDRPLVLASLGTVFNRTLSLLEVIIDGLARERINLIVVTGGDTDRHRFPAVPSNVHLEPWVPQSTLLPLCDLFITHGGFNSVKESLIAGVPMVLVPVTGDQPYCAQRCAALGAGRVIGPSDRTPAAVRDAVRLVLADPSYAARAGAFGHEMSTLPGLDHLVQLCERLAVGAAVARRKEVQPMSLVARTRLSEP